MNFRTRYGPWALVAGASEGLGAAWAEALVARGLNVILLARRQAVLTELAASLKARHVGIEVETAVIDLGSPTLVDELGRLVNGRDIGLYVHNAAFVPHGAFLERPLREQQLSLDVNCRAPLALAHTLGTAMAHRGRGGIVLMSSLTAFQGTPLLATYGATKAFNLTLAEGLHGELAPRGVDVLACCAG
ncbi:MAG: SDR family NAD(P)-dependent oxidoreductase, partial [Archangium sp.]|nr:SDR family NAD(P)-dependent oxidoreductase [Archangium sp.]